MLASVVGGGARARRTDTIAAINTGEQPLTSPSEGPILYFISKLIPRDQIYCKKRGEKIHLPAPPPTTPVPPSPVIWLMEK